MKYLLLFITSFLFTENKNCKNRLRPVGDLIILYYIDRFLVSGKLAFRSHYIFFRERNIDADRLSNIVMDEKYIINYDKIVECFILIIVNYLFF
jgi:hypothetical protein